MCCKAASLCRPVSARYRAHGSKNPTAPSASAKAETTGKAVFAMRRLFTAPAAAAINRGVKNTGVH